MLKGIKNMPIKSFRGETAKVEHYRDTKDGPVTKVVNTARDGSVDVYSNPSGVIGSSDYGHKGYNSSGAKDANRDPGIRKGSTFKGFAMECMSELSFVKLQQIEMLNANNYVKRSARHFMERVCPVIP